jgi:hypothetical protein
VEAGKDDHVRATNGLAVDALHDPVRCDVDQVRVHASRGRGVAQDVTVQDQPVGHTVENQVVNGPRDGHGAGQVRVRLVKQCGGSR